MEHVGTKTKRRTFLKKAAFGIAGLPLIAKQTVAEDEGNKELTFEEKQQNILSVLTKKELEQLMELSQRSKGDPFSSFSGFRLESNAFLAYCLLINLYISEREKTMSVV